MRRNNGENISKKNTRMSNYDGKSKKAKVEKGIVFGALLIIIMALFVLPKYEAYAKNKELLVEKTRYNMELPDEMSEATYLEKIKNIGELLEDSKKSIPENIDTIQLYDGVAKITESCQLTLISVQFDPVESRIDDILGTRIETGFLEKDERTIQVSDEKFLTTCRFEVICSGNDNQFTALLNELNQHRPLIRVLNYEIKSETTNKKIMTLKLESYGIQEVEQINKKNGYEKTVNEQE